MATLGYLISSFLASVFAVPTLITILGTIFSRTWWQAVLWAVGAAVLGAIMLRLIPYAMDLFVLRVVSQIVVASIVWFIACHVRRHQQHHGRRISHAEKAPPKEKIEKEKRPASITVICVLGFIGAPLIGFLIFSPVAQQAGHWLPPYLILSSLIWLECLVGLWMMRKWAAYTYTGLTALNQVVLLGIGTWSVTTLLLPGIVIFVALKNVTKMT